MVKKQTIFEKELKNDIHVFKLLDVLEKKGISYTKFIKETDTSYWSIMRYGKGTVQKIDIAFVDKWCSYLKCNFADLIEIKKR